MKCKNNKTYGSKIWRGKVIRSKLHNWKERCVNLDDYFFKRILYWFGSSLDLLSACLIAEVYQASKVFLMQKEPLSMTQIINENLFLSFLFLHYIFSHFIFYPSKAVDRQPKAHVLFFFHFLARKRFYCNFDWVLFWLYMYFELK